MKVLHTSDWHIGKKLFNQDRVSEMKQFFDWLIEVVESENIDILLVCGDVFDSFYPSNQSQKLYYDFLARFAKFSNKHLIITAGNHDSASFLSGSKELLTNFNIHVVANISENVADAIITIDDENGIQKAIICAVPFIRMQDIKIANDVVNFHDRQQKYQEAIIAYYRDIYHKAKQLQINENVPILATAHLTLYGTSSVSDDGVRDIFIGNIDGINHRDIDMGFDYLALGHLHQNQALTDNIRYSGSPLMMTFNEINYNKQLLLLTFDDGASVDVSYLDIPKYQQLARITGDEAHIIETLQDMVNNDLALWLEVILSSGSFSDAIIATFNDIIKGSNIKILKLSYAKEQKEHIQIDNITTKLVDITHNALFDMLLKAKVAEEVYTKEQALEIKQTYDEAILLMQQEESEL